MMILSEEAPIAAEALPLQPLKDHLRLGSGFSDDALQDGVLIGCLRAALSVIEARTGKAIIARDFRLRLTRWRQGRRGQQCGQALPIAPISAVASVTILAASGDASEVASTLYRLELDMEQPRLLPAAQSLPAIPEGGAVEIVFQAGFGAWPAVPADLAQAVLLLAARFYEGRHQDSGLDAGHEGQALPRVVHALIERWRKVRVLGGGI